MQEEYKQNWKDGITSEKLQLDSKINDLIEGLRKDFDEQTDRIIQEDAVNLVNNALKGFIEE